MSKASAILPSDLTMFETKASDHPLHGHVLVNEDRTLCTVFLKTQDDHLKTPKDMEKAAGLLTAVQMRLKYFFNYEVLEFHVSNDRTMEADDRTNLVTGTLLPNTINRTEGTLQFLVSKPPSDEDYPEKLTQEIFRHQLDRAAQGLDFSSFR